MSNIPIFQTLYLICRSLSCLETLSNELLFDIFSYMYQNDIMQGFLNLNQRFKNLQLFPLPSIGSTATV